MRNLDHTLAAGSIYFAWQPKRFLFEPIEKFTDSGRDLYWDPDVVAVLPIDGKPRVYAIEVQLSHLTPKQWAKKWEACNIFFNRGYYRTAAFQAWGGKDGKYIVPQFVVISRQKEKDVRTGFEVENKELIITDSLKG
ncbi:hypothetical protein [Paenibacillus thermotolerans]|uniref:hypothetical protein n=1 Tax=Paenibacillus thermotolerans TaxID=3027807 RepID=UPI00236764D1|nr:MULTISPECIES: hypothetical protein [unclassified Paenibacillus]